MAQYVKFLRGSPTAYLNLAYKDPDTLYFIYENDKDTGLLYLGSKLIAGGKSDLSISDLKGISLDRDLIDKSFLVYDEKSQAWVNKSLAELTFNGTAAGFVPAPAEGELNLYLKSDGTWGTPPDASHTILTLSNTDHSAHTELLAANSGNDNIDGDIIIIKDAIFIDAEDETKNKWQYTSYVFESGAWHAMDGNYNAENVYFDEDLITTTAIGNITLTNGQATIAASGKNLKEVFNTIFVKEKNPSTTQPSVSITLTEAGAYEVGSVVTPNYSASLNAGSYTYGPATGITATSWAISDTANKTATIASGTLDDVEVIDGINYTVTATATYDDGKIPLTNTGNQYASGQIKAGSKSKTSSAITGYRNTFYGALTEKSTLTSDIIRGLTKSDSASVNGSAIDINVPVGALRVVFAYPAGLNDLTQVLDKNDSNSNIISGFTKIEVDVEGANNYDAIAYKVYYIDFANPYDTTNVFKVTI